MDVDPAQAAEAREYKGKTYYFCSRGCIVAFDKAPERYLGTDAEAEAGDIRNLSESYSERAPRR
jgi:Cu+-exporting ATPase